MKTPFNDDPRAQECAPTGFILASFSMPAVPYARWAHGRVPP